MGCEGSIRSTANSTASNRKMINCNGVIDVSKTLIRCEHVTDVGVLKNVMYMDAVTLFCFNLYLTIKQCMSMYVH